MLYNTHGTRKSKIAYRKEIIVIQHFVFIQTFCGLQAWEINLHNLIDKPFYSSTIVFLFLLQPTVWRSKDSLVTRLRLKYLLNIYIIT